MSTPTPTLKARLSGDLTTAMKARDELVTATIRMTLAAIQTAEVAGKTARQLTDDEVLAVVTREAKKRREAADAFTAGGRDELAARERSEGEVLARYLPQQLTDDELVSLVGSALAEVGATSMKQMGAAIKAAQAKASGRAAGGRIAAEVKKQLAG